MEGFNTSGALVIDAEAYAQPSHTTNQMGGGGDLAGLSPTPLTPSGGASSMCVHHSHRQGAAWPVTAAWRPLC